MVGQSERVASSSFDSRFKQLARSVRDSLVWNVHSQTLQWSAEWPAYRSIYGHGIAKASQSPPQKS